MIEFPRRDGIRYASITGGEDIIYPLYMTKAVLGNITDSQEPQRLIDTANQIEKGLLPTVIETVLDRRMLFKNLQKKVTINTEEWLSFFWFNTDSSSNGNGGNGGIAVHGTANGGSGDFSNINNGLNTIFD